ncbi:MAG: NADPH:quinone reductase-like Zn-dependent oxidoreductase [Halioglobus sp.]|jgi:NADPH:quinone reductase-like Zn-dependent oxidoreductase
MKAIYYMSHGGADVLQIGELPIPPIAEDEVLVQVAATSVNPIDRRLRSGELQEYITRTFPVVPGWDFSGRVVAVGDAVSNYEIGDDVVGLAFTWSIQYGTYAQYAPIKATSLTKKPKNISFEQAAALPLVSLTAWQSLSEFGQLQAGQSVLIHAGAGGLGSVAIPLAKYLGAKVYTTASSRNREYVESVGADVVIDYREQDYASVIRELEPQGLDLILQSLLDDQASKDSISLVRDGGAVAYMNNEPPEMPEIKERNVRAEFLHHRPDGESLTELLRLFSNGTLPVPRVQLMELEQAVEAHQLSEEGHTIGKLVLKIQNL